MILISITGFLATLLSLAVNPSQIINMVKREAKGSTFEGFSPGTVLVTLLTSILWTTYGIRFNAIWSSAIAVFSIVLMIYSLIILKRSGSVKKRFVVTTVIASAAFLVFSIFAGQNVLGFLGAIVSAAMFIPQAITTFKQRNNESINDFSLFSVFMIISANCTWTLYGILLDDIWIIIPSVIHVINGIIMLGAFIHRKKYPNLHR